MPFKRLQVISFFLLLLVVFIVVLFIVKPFAEIVAFGAILAILAYPVYTRLFNRLKSKNLAALLTLFLVILVVFIPAAFFGRLLVNDVDSVYDQFKSGGLVLRRDQVVQSLPAGSRVLIENLSRDLNNFLAHLTSNVFQSFSRIVSHVAAFIVALMVLVLTLFYLLRDGQAIRKFFTDMLPMATKQEDHLIEKIVLAVNGVVRGQFLVALTHGTIATIGFFIFGVPTPLIWGLFTVMAALVPVVGIWVSLVPAVLYLVVTGHTGNALGMAIWAIVGVLLVDTLVGPRIVGSHAKLHPLLVVLSVLGGIRLFGPLGFLLGPITMAIFVTLVGIYRTDFKDYVES